MRQLRPSETQWIFPPETLDKTPSRADGISLADELRARKQAIEWIRSLWARVAHVVGEVDAESTSAKGTITVGAVLLHRFFMRRSIKDFEPKLIAPTLLFLASKIEEGPQRLRLIVNACLAKFETNALLWDSSENPDNPPLEYRRWEKEILATEEVVLEALCFDMVVIQPWPILRRGVKGIDGLRLAHSCNSNNGHDESVIGQGHSGPVNGQASPHVNSKVSESIIDELGWAMLNEGLLSPLSVLYSPDILAFTVLVLVIAMVDQVPLSSALATGSELGSRFNLIVEFDEHGAVGSDVETVNAAIAHYLQYCSEGLIDALLPKYITPEPETKGLLHRHFKEVQVPTMNGSRVALNAL